MLVALLQKGATTMNAYEDGVNTIYLSPSSQRQRNYPFWSMGYSAALKNLFLSRDFFPTTSSSFAEMILRKLLILSADTDVSGPSPFDVAVLFGLPVAHVLASSSLFN